MIQRRSIALGLLAGLAAPAARGQESFETFLARVRQEALAAGVSPGTVDVALTGLTHSQRVIELDRRQPEFTITWAEYRDTRLSARRVEAGRRAFAQHRALLERIETRFGVNARVIVAVWGMETNYGSFTGGFNVIQALATLAWEGRRAAFFRGELMAALRILDAGHIEVGRMRGSPAGAMGNPQFMPTSFERWAVDFDGDGRRDIWDSVPDALASIANYLATHGWREPGPWGFEVHLPNGFDTAQADHRDMRPVTRWRALGVRPAAGGVLPSLGGEWAVVIPGLTRGGTQAFLAGRNFMAIRAYNPSNFYATAVGLLSDLVG